MRVVRRTKDADNIDQVPEGSVRRGSTVGKSVWEFFTNVVPRGKLNVVRVCV